MRRRAVYLSTLLTLSFSSVAFADDPPIALEKWGRYHVNITPYMPVMTPPKGKKVKWVPRVRLVFKMTSPETDDVIELQHYRGGRKWGPVQKCQIRSAQIIKRRGKGGKPMGYSLVAPECLMDEKYAISKTGKFKVVVSYKQTGMGKVHKNLGSYSYQVKHYNTIWPGRLPPIKGYYVDHDFRMGEAWLYRNGAGKIEIWTWFKYDRKGERAVRGGRMRCFVNGKKISFLENPTARTTNYHQHYPTRKTSTKITWGLFYWSAPRVGREMTWDWMKKNPGKYRCTLTQIGDIGREFYFEVADGEIKRAPCQGTTKPAHVKTLADEFLIKSVFKKIPDLKFDKRAFKKKGLYGRKWLKGCPL